MFADLFPRPRPVIACIHLAALPGAPRYQGDLEGVYSRALREAGVFSRAGLDGLIVENFGDAPFYPERLPAQSVAAMAAVTREIVRQVDLPVGVNALRNDARSALAIATAAGARFIRVNVHTGARLTDQGILQGRAHQTLRLRAALRSPVLIFADASVKHAVPLGDLSLSDEVRDLAERGLADAIILTGGATGEAARTESLDQARRACRLPLLVGSGLTPENLETYWQKADGFIVGSTFKREGEAGNEVEEARVVAFMERVGQLRP